MKKFTILFIVAVAANLIMGSDAYAQITQRGSATTSTTRSGSSPNFTVSLARPTGLAVGDVMLVNITQGDDNDGQTLSNASRSGWTVVGGGQLGVSGNNSWWGTVLYKIADASDVSTANYAFALDADVEGVAAGLIAFYNVNTTGGVLPDGTGTGPFDVAAGSFNVSGNTASTTVTAPGITTVTNNAAVIMFGNISNNTGISGWTTTSPGSLTEIYEQQSNTNPDQTSSAAWAIQSTAGATGNGTATIASNRWGAVLVALKPLFVNAGPDQLVNSGSVSLVGSTNAGSPVYAWTQVGGPAGPTITTPANSSTTVTGLASGNLYTFRLTVNGSFFDEVQVRMITGSNLWATSSDGTVISSFSTNGAAAIAGPVNMFNASFTGSTNTYTRTAALGRTQSPSQSAGYFYYLGTSTGGQVNNGLVEVWAASAAGNEIARIGTLDLNGGSTTNIGFVRLGMGPNGTGWILAGDGTTLYLAKFTPNGANPVTITMEDASVALSGPGASVANFVNGDICLDGNGRIVALANDGSGTTQVFVGDPTGASTTLALKWNLVDGSNNPFTGQVNGVAFEKSTGNSGLYISTSDGLYYINSTQANIPSGTIPCTIVWSGTGVQDLASNFFPNTIITPVSMTSFSVNKQGVSAILNWTTVTEINTDHFEIERSVDGINFTTVGSKAAAGNSTDVINYQHTDAIGSLSGVIYYRIKTVDMDGKVSYSKIVSLRLNGAVKAFNVYPNPFVSDLKVVLEAASDAAVTVRISNAAGQTVFSRATFVQKGNNVIVIASELSALQKGMYFVEVISEDGKQTQKIIKR